MNQDTLRSLLEATSGRRPVVLATRLETGDQALLEPLEGAGLGDWPEEAARRSLLTDTALTEETDEGRVFLRPYNPPARLVIIGAVHVAQPLVGLASAVGFDVIVVDPREAFARDFRFPGVELIPSWPDDALRDLEPDHRTAVVVLAHDPKLDDPAIITALSTPAFYIGVLGSRRTHAKRVERLTGQGITEEELRRLHAPVGLPIGARSPSEIALAITAEVVQALRSE